ncbi:MULTISPECIES: hypothetical protein [unclassified Pasteurella]|uniref:hypothetical protein n=1 Tax=unclassified Pasteurella TaxID=2621516 RepID=UPI0010748624|nr:hypothetical protein [Pasteurella sp. 19428wF3_WM03]TFU50984.1 hypothetical protein E4T92_06295 [Pasteurella sp. WM03]
MQDKIISEAIYDDLMSSVLQYYIDTLDKKSEKSSDLYGKMREIMSNLNNEQKNIIFKFIRNTIIDTASTILGTIDGTTFPKNADGIYILKYENQEIQGCLQDYFLAKAEDEK